MDPTSSDSDYDGMPDGKFYHGFDPTNPFDSSRDEDIDGFIVDGPFGFEAQWTNLDEYRYVSSSENGSNGTDPLTIDSDGDGLSDGEEYWGWFYDSTLFQCHYLSTGGVGSLSNCDNQMDTSQTSSPSRVAQFRIWWWLGRPDRPD